MIENGHVDAVRLLLDHGADINAVRTMRRCTALLVAIETGHVNVVRLLLEGGADVNDMTEQRSALMARSENGHLGVVRLLLQRGANIDFENEHGITAYSLAFMNQHADIARLILNWKRKHMPLPAQERSTDDLRQAVESDEASEVFKILKQNKNNAMIDLPYEFSCTLLILASRCGYTYVVAVLLYFDANINAQDERGRSPLMYACIWEHPKVVQLLLSSGLSLNINAFRF